jgi:hypothetical protein
VNFWPPGEEIGGSSMILFNIVREKEN